MLNLDVFAQSIYERDFLTFSKFFEQETMILGYTPEGYFSFITKNLNFELYKTVDIYTNLLKIKHNQYIIQIFFNEILIIEENILIDPNTNLIHGLSHTTDCFGKLAIFNDRFDRILTIRPKRGHFIKDVLILDEDLEDSLIISKGNMADDGYYVGYFKIVDDDFKTKTTTVKIVTDKGIEKQIIVLRGLDYPFFNVNKPIIDGNQLNLTENIKKIYKLSITLEGNHEIELSQSEISKNTFIFDTEIINVYQSINGCAMNYFINK